MKKKKSAGKAKEFDKVTAENFDAFERAVYEYERRNKKERAIWNIFKSVSDLVFFFLMLSAAYVFEELPVPPALQPVITSMWGSPEEDEITLAFVGGCMLIAMLVSFLVHTVPALILKPVWPCKTPAPVQGSGLERAEALQKHFRANCRPFLLTWTVLGVVVYPVVVVFLHKAWNRMEGLDLIIYIVFSFVVSALIYIIPYVVYSFVCLLFYNTSGGTGEAGDKLARYVLLSRLEEERREEDGKKEQNRLRGDALYRQATAEGRMDEELIAEAAELGSAPACLHVGRRLLAAWYEGQYTTGYTKAELEEMAELAMDYFTIAREEKMLPVSAAEAELGYLVFWEAAERLNMSMYDWKDALEKLRRLKASGMLPRRYDDIYDFAVEKAVDRIDMIAEHERWKDVTVSDVGSDTSSDSWDALNDDLDAVQRSLGGPGWSDGV